jgi:hypothetical protein
MGKKINDEPDLPVPLVRIEKHYTDEEFTQLMARNMDLEHRERENTDPLISLNGDTGRDDVPGPYFNWTITGKDPKELLRINKVLLNELLKCKRKKKCPKSSKQH